MTVYRHMFPSVPFAAVEVCSPVQLLVLLVRTDQVNLDEFFNEAQLHRDMLRELRLKENYETFLHGGPL